MMFGSHSGFVMSGETPVARFEGRYVLPLENSLVPLCFRNGGDLGDWLKHRAIDSSRANSRVLKRILNITDVSDEGTALYSHGAMLTDNYWVRLDGEAISYNSIKFSDDIYADIALNGLPLGGSVRNFPERNLDVLTPELTNIGSFEKCWSLAPGTWTMLKTSTPEERFSEIFIYHLCKAMGLPAAIYYDWNGRTASPDFTEGCLNFEPMRYLVGDDEDYELSYSVLYSLSCTMARQYLDIIFMDALVLNPDRHTDNYGLLRNRATGEILSLAPNFDNNLALISRGYSSDSVPAANPLIKWFCSMQKTCDPTYTCPKLPSAEDLHYLIRIAAGGMSIRQEYVYRMIVQNYEDIVRQVC